MDTDKHQYLLTLSAEVNRIVRKEQTAILSIESRDAKGIIATSGSRT